MAIPVPSSSGCQRALEVARLPARQEGVDGEHDRLVAGALGAADEARRELAAARPVELEPLRRRRRPQRPPRARTTTTVLRVIVSPTAAAARATASSPSGWTIDCTPIGASATRRRHPRVEHGHREVAVGDVAQHPRHDPPAPERLQVRAHRLLAPGAAEDVGGRPRILEPLLGQALELVDRDRVLGPRAAHAAEEDLRLIAGERRSVGGRLGHPRQPIRRASRLSAGRSARENSIASSSTEP